MLGESLEATMSHLVKASIGATNGRNCADALRKPPAFVDS